VSGPHPSEYGICGGDLIRWTVDLTRSVLRFFLVVSQFEIRVRPKAHLTSRRSPPGKSRD